jgi:phosphoribosylformimino-5-aminoimidazole carboxamide ribotide isomerase
MIPWWADIVAAVTWTYLMDVIPVLDLKGGVVVRARMGRRDQYRPIETPLSPTSDPVDVARGLMSLHPFSVLYVADLDAIERRGDNAAALRRLRAAFPGVTLWVDNGLADRAAAAAWFAAGLGDLVLGSEAQADIDLVRHLAADARVILSLDFRDQRFEGPPALLTQPDAWPGRVIVMTLTRVGSGAGPDLERLGTIRAAAADRRIYAAGGVRDAVDLHALKNAGVAGALVASCLHDGRVRGTDLAWL